MLRLGGGGGGGGVFASNDRRCKAPLFEAELNGGVSKGDSGFCSFRELLREDLSENNEELFAMSCC